MSEPFLGEIKSVAFNFPPRGYSSCSGQLLSIAQNSALFALLGTAYGGNGQVTFGLPNLQGRVALGQGQSPGTSNYVLGESSGTENVTLLQTQMPMHTHAATTTVTPDSSGLSASTTIHALTAPTAKVANPAGNLLTVAATVGTAPAAVQAYAAPGNGTDATMAPQMAVTNLSGAITAPAATTVGVAGGSQPFGILQPYLAINYVIALQGIFPARN